MAFSYTPQRRKRKADNFKFALGMGTNWADLDKGVMYMIQEYKEKLDDPTIPADKKPTKIRVCDINNTSITLDWVAPEVIQERMKDPEPDPKYDYVSPKHGKW